jgi:hypothetical protein
LSRLNISDSFTFLKKLPFQRFKPFLKCLPHRLILLRCFSLGIVKFWNAANQIKTSDPKEDQTSSKRLKIQAPQ